MPPVSRPQRRAVLGARIQNGEGRGIARHPRVRAARSRPDVIPGGLHLAAAGGVRSDGESAGPSVRVAAQIRVVIADQHAGMRRALRLLLEPEDGMLVVAETGGLVTALHQLRRHRPDVLLLDPYLLKGSGINAVRRLREQEPQTEIVVVTMDDCARLAEHVLNAGAIGFVLKDTADAELAPAIRRAARGEGYTSPRISLEPRSPEAPCLTNSAVRPACQR